MTSTLSATDAFSVTILRKTCVSIPDNDANASLTPGAFFWAPADSMVTGETYRFQVGILDNDSSAQRSNLQPENVQVGPLIRSPNMTPMIGKTGRLSSLKLPFTAIVSLSQLTLAR